MGGWVNFRYQVTNGDAPAFYSDLESKIGEYQRVRLYLVIVLPIMLLLKNNLSVADNPGPFFMILQGLSSLLKLLYDYGMIQLFISINKLIKTIFT